ncbi:MAG: hypothetical protein ABJJ69_19960 [Paracoccaceae bacterium]
MMTTKRTKSFAMLFSTQTILATAAQSQNSETVLEVWQTYLNTCGPILLDTKSGMSRLPEVFPGSGLTGVPDFSVTHFQWSSEDFTDWVGVEAWESATSVSISCEVFGTLPYLDLDERAAQITSMISQNPSLTRSGGKWELLIGTLTEDDREDIEEGTIGFSVSGVFPEQNVMTLLAFSSGSITIYYYASIRK